jgi:hypothetical protein
MNSQGITAIPRPADPVLAKPAAKPMTKQNETPIPILHASQRKRRPRRSEFVPARNEHIQLKAAVWSVEATSHK